MTIKRHAADNPRSRPLAPYVGPRPLIPDNRKLVAAIWVVVYKLSFPFRRPQIPDDLAQDRTLDFRREERKQRQQITSVLFTTMLENRRFMTTPLKHIASRPIVETILSLGINGDASVTKGIVHRGGLVFVTKRELCILDFNRTRPLPASRALFPGAYRDDQSHQPWSAADRGRRMSPEQAEGTRYTRNDFPSASCCMDGTRPASIRGLRLVDARAPFAAHQLADQRILITSSKIYGE